MRVKIGYQGGDQDDVNLQDPWKHLRWSLGLHLLEDGNALLDNGVANADKAGKVYINSIEVDGVPMMPRGLHLIGPRALLPIRRTPVDVEVVDDSSQPKERAAWTAAGRARGQQVSDAIRIGKINVGLGFPFDAMGPWFPAGDEGDPGMQPGAVSGTGIEPLPGFERSSRLRLLRADHTMHRMPISYVDVATGKPLSKINQPQYALSRGRSKVTSLAEFMQVIAGAAIWDDRRIERACNVGSCNYEPVMLGFDFYRGVNAYNGEHVIRGYRDALAGWLLFRDPLCKMYLDKIAADEALVWGQMPPLTRHSGVDWAGRECGWALHVMKEAGNIGAAALDRGLRQVRMAGSLHQKRAWPGPGKTTGGAPDPYDSNPPYVLHSEKYTQSIEAAIVGYACSESEAIANSLTANGNPTHFMIVESNMAAKLDHRPNERESFNMWFCFGKALQNGGGSPTLLGRIPTLRLPDDSTVYHDAPQLLAGAAKNPHIQQLAALIKGLEAIGA